MSSRVEAEDVRRTHSVRELEKALSQYLIDYGAYPGNPAIPEGAGNTLPVCRASFAESGADACVNLDLLLSLRYLSCLPQDGSETDPERSGYSVHILAGRAQVTALHSGEMGEGSCETLPESMETSREHSSKMCEVCVSQAPTTWTQGHGMSPETNSRSRPGSRRIPSPRIRV